MPSFRPAESDTLQAMVCKPSVSVLVSNVYAPIGALALSRFRNRVGFDVRVVVGGCGDGLPKMFDTSSLQYTPIGTGFPTVPRHWL